MCVSKKFVNYLDDHDVNYTILSHQASQSAIENVLHLSCDVGEMAKVVAMKIDKVSTLCILPANEKIDVERLKKEIGAKQIRFLSIDEVNNQFGDCEPGAIPAFAELYDMPAYCSNHFNHENPIYFGAGTHTDIVMMPYNEFLELVRPHMGNISVPLYT